MYLNKTRGYYRSGDQVCARGAFLLLIQLKDKPCNASNTYAIVRKVALRQFGHFMMGRANLCGKWRVVSGAYGSDGLPMDVDQLPNDAVQLPQDLYDAWNHGDGWNSAGKEAPDMRTWAKAQFNV